MAGFILNRLLPIRPVRPNAGSNPASGASSGTDPKLEPQHYTVAAELPGLAGEAPLWRMQVEITEQPEGDGLRMRMRVRMQTALGDALTRATERAQQRLSGRSAPNAALGGRRPTGPQALGHEGSRAVAETRSHSLVRSAVTRTVGGAITGLVDIGLRQPLVQKLIDPLKTHDINTWFEVQASTADLDGGATALLPEADKFAKVGIQLSAPHVQSGGAGGPLLESWATPGVDERSFAAVSVMRMAKEHLPEGLREMLGQQPFHLAAAMVNVVEPHRNSARPADKDESTD